LTKSTIRQKIIDACVTKWTIRHVIFTLFLMRTTIFHVIFEVILTRTAIKHLIFWSNLWRTIINHLIFLIVVEQTGVILRITFVDHLMTENKRNVCMMRKFCFKNIGGDGRRSDGKGKRWRKRVDVYIKYEVTVC
jgi:hypothetical protein